MFYTMEESLNRIFEREARQMGCNAKDSAQLFAWQRQARAKLWQLAGMDSLQACPLEPRLLEREECVGYVREKWLIQTQPDVWMPFYVLSPQGATGRLPVLVNPHGHGGGKENTALESPGRIPLSVRLARQGVIVFCPDAAGAGERREKPHQSEDKASMCFHREQLNILMNFGRTVAGVLTWDLMRLLDYIQTRPDCDAGRIGCAGFSGGGMQTLWLSALDERITCAFTSGYFYGVRQSLMELPQNCGCNFVPGLWRCFDMGDMGAMIAPRPLLIESGERDHLNGRDGIGNVLPQVGIAREAYALCGAERALWHAIHGGVHENPDLRTEEFFLTHLRPERQEV